MQEFEFVVAYEAGADRLMDVFREHPSLSVRSSACYTDDSSMWRMDHASGSREAMGRFDETFLDDTRCNECLNAPDCNTTREYHVLDRTPAGGPSTPSARRSTSATPSRTSSSTTSAMAPMLQSHRTDNEYRWKALFPDEQPVGELFDAIEAELRDGLTLELAHLTQSGNWSAETRTAHKLSPEQHGCSTRRWPLATTSGRERRLFRNWPATSTSPVRPPSIGCAKRRTPSSRSSSATL